MLEKIFHSMKEIDMKYFPDRILNRLGKEIHKEIYLFGSYVLTKHDNKSTGTFYFPNPRCNVLSLDNLVSSFYKSEGFKVKTDKQVNLIDVKKENEHYWIYLTKNSIYVSEIPTAIDTLFSELRKMDFKSTKELV